MPQVCCLNDQFPLPFHRNTQCFLSHLILLSPLLPNLFTPIRTVDPTYVLPFVRAIAAECVVTFAIVDRNEGKVGRDVASVFAIETWQSEGYVVGRRIDGRCIW